jgi:hypothetical protein
MTFIKVFVTRGVTVRCEQGGGLDVWVSRGVMLDFVGDVAVELTTGKGVLQVIVSFLIRLLQFVCVMDALQNVGLTAPFPSLALGLTSVVGAFTTFIIFQSGS